jgi:hypothetical protein
MTWAEAGSARSKWKVRVEAVGIEWERLGARICAPRRTAAKFAGSDMAPGRGYFNEERSGRCRQ